MSPFTPEVLSCIENLRNAIEELTSIDTDLASTMTALTNQLVSTLEDQMMLVFANIALKSRQDQEDLLRQQREDLSLLEYYQSIVGDSATMKVDPNTKKVSVHGRLHGDLESDIAPQNGTLMPVDPAQKCLLTGLHLLLESTGYQLQAERTILYVAQRGTGTLRVVSSAPNIRPAQQGAFIASHQGVIGSVFSTGVAIRADSFDEETQKNYVHPLDKQLGLSTYNTLVFPVLDPSSGAPVAVIECANKLRGAPFTPTDEVLLHHACTLVWYLLCYHEVDFFNGMIFNPAPLHTLRPFRPSIHSEELDAYPGATGARKPQLVVRINKKMGKEKKIDLPHTVRGKTQNVDSAVEVATIFNVRELRSYLTQMEETHRRVMSDVLQARDREDVLREEVGKKSHRIRLLEENAQFLHESLVEAKRAMNNSSFAPMENQNFRDFTHSGMGSKLGQFLAERREDATSGVREAKSNPGEVGDRSPFLSSAAEALAKLRTAALKEVSPSVIARAVANTPQPKPVRYRLPVLKQKTTQR